MKFVLPKDPDFLNNLAELLYEVRAVGLRSDNVGTYKRVTITNKNNAPLDPRTLAYLQEQKIADVWFKLNDYVATIAVFDHYRLSHLIKYVYEATEYVGLSLYGRNPRHGVAVYDSKTGVGLINGNRIDFTRKQDKTNKRLFDALFQGKVDRERLKNIIRADDTTGTRSAYDVSAAFTKLRKVCGVGADVICLRDSGWLAVLYKEKPDQLMIKRLTRGNLPKNLFDNSVK